MLGRTRIALAPVVAALSLGVAAAPAAADTLSTGCTGLNDPSWDTLPFGSGAPITAIVNAGETLTVTATNPTGSFESAVLFVDTDPDDPSGGGRERITSSTFPATLKFSFPVTGSVDLGWGLSPAGNADWQVSCAANEPPDADAGQEQTVHAGALSTLDGSGSTDPDDNALTYEWTFVSQPAGSTATLSNSNDVSPTLTTDKPGEYVIGLVVEDEFGLSDESTVTISAINISPVADAGSDQTVNPGALVNLRGTQSYDPDGDDISFSWSLRAPLGSSAVLNNVSSPTPSFIADVVGTYTATLIVNDGFVNSDQVTVDITVVPLTITDLIASVNALQLPAGTKNSLLQKLTGAQKDLAKRNAGGACDKLTSFIAQVTALRDKRIVPAQTANDLIADTEEVRDSIGCG